MHVPEPCTFVHSGCRGSIAILHGLGTGKSSFCGIRAVFTETRPSQVLNVVPRRRTLAMPHKVAHIIAKDVEREAMLVARPAGRCVVGDGDSRMRVPPKLAIIPNPHRRLGSPGRDTLAVRLHSA